MRFRAQCLRSPWESLGTQWHFQFLEVASCRTSELCSLWTLPLGRAVPAGGFLEGCLLGPGERAAGGADRGWTLRASQDVLELGVSFLLSNSWSASAFLEWNCVIPGALMALEGYKWKCWTPSSRGSKLHGRQTCKLSGSRVDV